MKTLKIEVAEVLYSTLSIFHSINRQRLQSVWGVTTEGSLDKLIFDFDSAALVVIADGDDDSVEFELVEKKDWTIIAAVDRSNREPWKDFIGKRFGWGWITVNQQGYCDGLLFSFEDVVPRVVLNVAASSFKVGLISESPT